MVGEHTYPETRRQTDTSVNKRAEPHLIDRTSVEDNDAYHLHTASKTTPPPAPPLQPTAMVLQQRKEGRGGENRLLRRCVEADNEPTHRPYSSPTRRGSHTISIAPLFCVSR